ncbi:MAG TPA: hypothetical protein VFY25_10885, partial [Anaerolineales bacterium]|nr:hypothetical protein [Anaerolineales bacterium]
MIDPTKILQRAWHILWNYRTLWIFGLILALAAGSSYNGGGNNGVQWREDGNNNPTPPPNVQEFFRDLNRELDKLFREGIPDANITGQALTAFLWTIGVFVVFLLIVGIVVAIARYVSETAVIRMVDEYENNGTKMTVREGFRIGWSRTAWRLFLINLIVNLPVILFFIVLIIAGTIIFLTVTNGNEAFTAVSVVGMIGLVFLSIFVVIIVSIFLGLLRHFFWRVAVLENAGVRESLRRGWAMVRENWKNVGLMWLVMIGLGIAWIVVSIIAIIITIPIVILTGIVAAIVAAIPLLLLVGLFSLFLTGP